MTDVSAPSATRIAARSSRPEREERRQLLLLRTDERHREEPHAGAVAPLGDSGHFAAVAGHLAGSDAREADTARPRRRREPPLVDREPRPVTRGPAEGLPPERADPRRCPHDVRFEQRVRRGHEEIQPDLRARRDNHRATATAAADEIEVLTGATFPSKSASGWALPSTTAAAVGRVRQASRAPRGSGDETTSVSGGPCRATSRQLPRHGGAGPGTPSFLTRGAAKSGAT